MGTVLVNRYQLQEVIGIGGMGSVYRARDMHFPNVLKLVAVKEMINQAADPLVRQTIVQNFEREANILVTLNHPSIPKIYDFFTHAERSYLVEEFINGKDLETILRQNPTPISEEQAVLWAIEICDVLEYLHTHPPEPIIFRDIKPSNIMINQLNRVVLVDFGIAKVFKTGQKGTMIGTEGYSPPEQYRGDASMQTDIYALGATMHYMLTHRDPRLEAPFSFKDRPIREINPAVSPDLELIVGTALQYNPEDRFPTATEMKAALVSLAKRTGALTKANSARLILQEQAVKPVWEFSCEDEIRSSPTVETGMVFTGSYDNNVYALTASKGEFAWKFATEGAITSKPLMDNGMLYFGSEDGKLYAVTAKTGKLVWDFPTQGPIRGSGYISEGHVFFGSDDHNLYAVNVASYRKSWSLNTEGAIRSTPFIQNGLIYFGNEAGEFICADFRGQIKWRFNARRANTSSALAMDGMVYFSSLDGNIYALDAKSGWVIWRFRMGKGSASSPCISENMVMVGSADGFFYSLDRSSSRELWRFKCDHQVSGSPTVFNGGVYFGTGDGTFYCLDCKTGRQRWKYPTHGAILGAPAASNDLIFIGSSDHKVYAFLP